MIEQPGLPSAPSPPVRPVAGFGRLNWDELLIYSDLIAAFYEREGRDPIGIEYSFIIIVVRLMALAGAWRLH